MSDVSLLVKVGDVWLDPLRVTSIEGLPPEMVCESIEDGEDGAVVHFGTRPPRNVGCEIIVGGMYRHPMVSPDEAARIINRAREAHMVKR